MARIRTVKPDTFKSHDMRALTWRQRYMFVGLWTYVDDAGRGDAHPGLIKGELFPLDSEVTADEVYADLLALESNGQIALYSAGDRQYLEVLKFASHQRINRPTESKLPARMSAHDSLTEQSVNVHGGLTPGREGKGREQGGERASAPAPFCPKHPTGTDAPCRPCGNARRQRDAWDEAAKSKPTISTIGGAPADPTTCPHRSIEPSGYCTRCGEKPGVAA